MITLANHDKRKVENSSLRNEPFYPTQREFHSPPRGTGLPAETIQLVQTEPRSGLPLDLTQRIKATLHYMMQHLHQPMKVTVLSTMAGLSQSRFFEVFKDVTGQTPLNFFTRARMHRAGELLDQTKLRIKEVAALLGYDDQFYFSRVFKSVHGIPPREYRKNRIAKNQRK
jgi:AraC-like DNA-binding protein